MYAVVTSGGKQYRVEPGATLLVERLTGEPGAAITFERVLLFGDGDRVTVGTPTVDGVTVRGTVLGEERGPKLIVFKYRPKARYRRRSGHRQHLTRVRIDAIETPDGKRARREQPSAEATADAGVPPDAVGAKPRRRSRTTSKTAPSETEQSESAGKSAASKSAPSKSAPSKSAPSEGAGTTED